MTLDKIVNEMRGVAKANPHYVTPDQPVNLAKEDCFRIVNVMGYKVVVVFTFAIHGHGSPNTWNLSLNDDDGQQLPPPLVAMFVKAFLGTLNQLFEVDPDQYPPEMKAKMPPGFRQFFTIEPVQHG